MVLSACGCSNDVRLALLGKGFLQIKDFLVIQPKDVAGMVANLARIPTNQGGAKIGMVIMKKVEALIMWCHDREREGLEPDANTFEQDTLSKYVKKGQLDAAGDQTSMEPPTDLRC